MYELVLNNPQVFICYKTQPKKKNQIDSKPNMITRDERLLNRIVISNRFANCDKISKAWNV